MAAHQQRPRDIRFTTAVTPRRRNTRNTRSPAAKDLLDGTWRRRCLFATHPSGLVDHLPDSEALPKFGYTHSQVDAVCEMVRATKVPQQPRNKLSRILCDADLDYLGRPDFFRIGATLFTEFKHYEVVKTEREWNELQVRFLSKHRYFTAHSKRVRQPVKQLHLAAVKDWLERDAEGMAAH